MSIISLGCNVRERRGDEFVAYCATKAGFSVDQGVYFLALDDRVVRSMKEADILLLGNSKLQLGLIPSMFESAIHGSNLKFHYLGFGGEQYRFADAIIEKYQLRPKLIVINVDPFFEDHLHWAGDLLLTQNPVKGYAIFLYRKAAQDMRGAICGWLPPQHPYCRGAIGTVPVGTVFRSTVSGAWRFAIPQDHGSHLDPIVIESDGTYLRTLAGNARRFLDRMALPKECVLMLQVPGREVNPGLLDAIVESLPAVLISAAEVPLESFDGDHLTTGSARAWTAAVMSGIERGIRACLGTSQTRDMRGTMRPAR